jgi:hypothetical protein
MTKTKKVMLCGRKDVLGGAFEAFLADKQDWDVVRITEDSPAEDFIQVVKQENPDVVILYESSLFRATPLPAKLMQNCPKVRVITASLQDNNLEVYDKQKICINNVADFFAAIEG